MIKADIAGKRFEFRNLNRDEFVAVQDALGNPNGDNPRFATAWLLAVQSACVGSRADLNTALDSDPGAIMEIGGAIYTAAMGRTRIITGE